MKQEFKVGDRVSWWSELGVVIRTYYGDNHHIMNEYPITVQMEDGQIVNFRSDGAYLKGQTPSLILTGRPSEKAEANPQTLNLSLIKAAHRGDLDEVKQLIRLGADISFEHELAYRVAKCFDQDEVATFLKGLIDIGFSGIK